MHGSDGTLLVYTPPPANIKRAGWAVRQSSVGALGRLHYLRGGVRGVDERSSGASMWNTRTTGSSALPSANQQDVGIHRWGGRAAFNLLV